MSDAPEELVVEIQEGPTFRFRSWEKLDHWVFREREVWTWLTQSSGENPGSVISNARAGLDRLENRVSQAKAAGEPLSALKNEIENTFSNFGAEALFHSESILGEKILEIREIVGEDAAIFALAFARNRTGISEARTRHRLRAAIMISAPEITPVSLLKDRLLAERANYRSAVHRLNDFVEAAELKRNLASEAAAKKYRKLAWMWVRRALRGADGRFRGWDEAQKDSVASIRQVEGTFRQFMELQAPVEYWRDKADRHREAEISARGRLLLFFPLVVIFLVALFYGCAQFLILTDPKTIHPALYFIVSAGLASIAGVAFWAGRLLSKLYLSEHHLRHDAEERAVMTRTYLALTHEKAAEEIDRQIILTALFRSTPDGIVKDDGPPEIGLPAILGRILGK